MLTLGIHGSYTQEYEDPDSVWLHDSAAAILKDGAIVAAIEEERLSRVKHTSAFPLRAIEHCLKAAGARLSDCDIIAYNQSEMNVAIESRTRFIKDPFAPRRFDSDVLSHLLEERFECPSVAQKLRFCSHHLAHAWSAFFLSGFSASLVVCLDGGGENAPGPDLSGLIGRFDGDSFEVLCEHPAEQRSIGLWYRTAMTLLGYRLFDEYKVMGLAPYGHSHAFEELAASWYRLLPDGDFTLASSNPMEFFLAAQARGLLEQARRKDEPLNQTHYDLAHALQQAVEKVILHVVTHFRERTGERSLCLAGGVAQNSSANGKLLHSMMFDRIFVQPASYDAGGALGAALHATKMEGGQIRPYRLRHVYLGSDASAEVDQVISELKAWSSLIRFDVVDDGIERHTAQLLAAGKIVGWVQGRSEFGPRALGNRSILADPRPAENKDRVNAMVKKREGYRPFAPSVLAERAAQFFEVPDAETDLSFMTFVVPVKAHQRRLLAAITHVDGTARIQTVAADINPRFHKLIAEFGKLTDVPVLLNTSFNNDAEPIVESARDAVATFLTTGLDALVIGDCLVHGKVDLASDPTQCLTLRVTTRPSRRLVRTLTVGGAARCVIDIAAPVKDPPIQISEVMFRILSRSTAREVMLAVVEELGVPPSMHRDIAREAFDLWQRRAIDLHP
jgi:carbamoyltransferase